MSYSLVGYFYYKNELISEVCLNQLKNVNPMRYSSQLDNQIEPAKALDIKLPEEIESKNFYNFESFQNALPYYKKILKKDKKDLKRMKKIISSVEYYKLSDEQKEELFENIEEVKEVMNDHKWALKSVKYAIDVFVYLSDLRIGDEYYRDPKDITLVLSSE